MGKFRSQVSCQSPETYFIQTLYEFTPSYWLSTTIDPLFQNFLASRLNLIMSVSFDTVNMFFKPQGNGKTFPLGGNFKQDVISLSTLTDKFLES